jgi:hypothetical protein
VLIWADEIDAAAKLGHFRGAAKLVGNSAKLRDALEYALSGRPDWVERAVEALSQPARNCDLHDKDDAHAEWEASGTRRAFSDWLLSRAGEENVE